MHRPLPLVLALFTLHGASAQINLVKDFGITGTDPFPRYLKASGDLLYFTAYEAASGWELWRSDGTTAGTVLLKDINPGAANGTPVDPWAVDVDGILYFAADDGAHGTELWRTDGTEVGTALVKDIAPGSSSSSPAYPLNHGGALLFTADAGTGRGLWTSDGSDAGTQLVMADFWTYSNVLPVIMNGIAYFEAYNSVMDVHTLWRTDGTTGGTWAVRPPANGGPHGVASLCASEADHLVYFRSSTDDPDGQELWRSDGSEVGTNVIDIAPGAASSSPVNIGTMGDTAYFAANDGTNGNGLYRYRPGFGVEHLSAVTPSWSGISPQMIQMVAINGIMYFVGSDPATGSELCSSDGTAAGTAVLKDINPGVNGGVAEETTPLLVVGDSIYFRAYEPNAGSELWVSDGTAMGTVLVQDRTPFPGESFTPMELTRLGNSLFMRGTVNGVPNQLYKLDLDWATRVAEVSERTGPRIYPNPATDVVRIDGLRPGDHVRVYDMAGRLVMGPRSVMGASTSLPINVLGRPTGAVVVQVMEQDGSVWNRRIVLAP